MKDPAIAARILLILGPLVLLQGCAAPAPGQPTPGTAAASTGGVCVPPEHMASCAAEGGCAFVTREALLRMLHRAAVQGAERGAQLCKGGGL